MRSGPAERIATSPAVADPPQRDGDLIADGVCLVFIADKAGISQPSASKHMELLAAAAGELTKEGDR